MSVHEIRIPERSKCARESKWDIGCTVLSHELRPLLGIVVPGDEGVGIAWVQGPGASPPPRIQQGVIGMAEVEGGLEGAHAANITFQTLAKVLMKCVSTRHKDILEIQKEKWYFNNVRP